MSISYKTVLTYVEGFIVYLQNEKDSQLIDIL